jgi:hypothetical protein
MTVQLLRVVALRKGKLKSFEFRLRPGERGLSLFRLKDSETTDRVIEAVRGMGKTGDLAVAVIDAATLRSLGLVLVPTAGGTPFADINALHVEARLAWWRKVLLSLRGVRDYDYFNENLSERICSLARVLN